MPPYPSANTPFTWALLSLLVFWTAPLSAQDVPSVTEADASAAAALAATPEVSYANQEYTYRRGGIEARLWVPYPPGGDVVRGVFQRGNAGSGNFMCWVDDPQFRRYAEQHEFGMCSTRGIWGAQTYETYGAMILEAYEMWAALGHHPELANVVFVVFGNSSSGAFTYGFSSLIPKRVVCFAVNVPAPLRPVKPIPGLLKVPGIFVAGEVDELVGNLSAHIEPLMQQARLQGALWSKIEVEGMGHEHRRTLHLFYPFFEKCLKLRYPDNANPRQGPVKLNSVKENSGWIADDATCETGWTEIASFSEFDGNRRGPNTSWLLDEDMAILHRGYSSRNTRVTLWSEDELPWPAYCNNSETIERAPGDTILLAAEVADLDEWETATLYQGANPIETIHQEGNRFWFEVVIPEDTNKRYQAFHIIVENENGQRHPSHMYTTLVLPNE